MPMHVCTGGMMQCTFGMAPSTFNATPKQVMTGNMPAGNIMDHVPMTNIPPFGMCQSLANPTVAAATAAALGVLTPMPCIPATVAPWMNGATQTLVGGKPALTLGATCQCAYGGVIQILNPGAMKTLEG